MRAIEVKSFGEPEVLEIVEKDIPVPGEGQVVVDIKAVGVNPVETYIRAGTYPVLPELPYIPGGNGAGTIHALGEGVEGISVGTRVYVAARGGAYSEYCLCQADEVFSLPDNVSFAEGAAIGVPAATAYKGLFIRGDAKPGAKVLVHGASGSVGMAALQLGSGAGLRMFGTAGTDAGLELIRKKGGEAAVLHKGDYAGKLKEVSEGGFDLILEMLANKNLEMDLDLLAPAGRVVIIGSRGRIEIDPRATMGKETDIRGLALAASSAEELKEIHAKLHEAMAAGVYRPVVSCTMDFTEAPEAHKKVMEDGNCGKIVLIP